MTMQKTTDERRSAELLSLNMASFFFLRRFLLFHDVMTALIFSFDSNPTP